MNATESGRHPRAVALSVLSQVRRRDAFAHPLLDAALAAASLPERDAALVTRLVYGTLSAQGTLDEAIDRFADRPGSIEPRVRDGLRAAAYELLFMRSASHAVVNEWVGEIKRFRPRAAGLANAVLRRLASDAPDFPWGDPSTDLDALGRSTGHPRWMVDLFIADHGADKARDVLRADDEPAPLYLWHVPFMGPLEAAVDELERDGAEPERCYHEGCILAARPSAAVRGQAVATGRVLVADAAAQVAALATGGHPGAIVVDAAAGRGTKTIQLQALSVAAGGAADLRALDLHAFKAGVLERRMRDLRVPGVTVAAADATAPSGPGVPQERSAAAVLLDAPCTGLGTLRRHVEKRWRLAPDDMSRLAVLQRRLLAGVAPIVAEGGRLVYSTCSIARGENDVVADDFLASDAGRGFEPLQLRDVLPEAWAPCVGADGRFRTLQRESGPDGHFVAAFRRLS